MKKPLPIFLLGSALAFTFACDSGLDNQRFGSSAKKSSEDKDGRSGNLEAETASAETVAEQKSEAINLTSLKLKDCDKLKTTMSKLTGVKATAPKIAALFPDGKATGCPGESKALDAISPAYISLTIKLSTEYCGLFTEKIMSGNLIPSLNFASTPRDAFASDAVKQDIATFFYNNIWNGDVRSDVPDIKFLEDESNKLIEEILTEDTVATKADGTKFVLQGVCTQIMAAAPVTME